MIETVLLLMFAAGVSALYFERIEVFYERVKAKIMAAVYAFSRDEYLENTSPSGISGTVTAHIGRLLYAAFFIGNRIAVTAFILLCVLSGTAVFILSFGVVSVYLSFFMFVTACFLPYLMLLGQVQIKRVSSSREGEILVTELLNNYKINYCNMRQAVEVTALTIEQAPNCKRLLFNLAKGLNNAAEGERLEYLIEEFRFAIGTSWAGILTANIYLSCQTGLKVTKSLSDLAESMRKAREVEELSKRENNESFLILKYLVPASAAGLAVGASVFFDISFLEMFHYQFRTRVGITWFLMWMLSYAGAVAVNILFTKKKFDL